MQRARRWIARGLEHLLQTDAGSDTAGELDFDIIIVGSGYGGSMAAAELAGQLDVQTGQPVRLCVLERGEEYLPGSFPADEAVLPGHVRFSVPIGTATEPRGQATGLFDVRAGQDACVLLANGLGGGSLINAGVLAEPTAEVLAGPQWPAPLQRDSLSPYLARARTLLRASGPTGSDQTILEHRSRTVPLKFTALQRLGTAQPGAFQPATLATAMADGVNAAGVHLKACTQCGGCATGCNFQAKNSLDENLLVTAWRHGAHIYTGATVLRLERFDGDSGWVVHVVHTDPQLRRHQSQPLRLRTRRLILAAGTLGSTEILLRSRSDSLDFSARLGMGFSGNGDMFAVIHGQHQEAGAVATDAAASGTVVAAGPGPSITAMLDLRDAAEKMAVQEFAIPAALSRLFNESFMLAHTLHQLARPDRRHHSPADTGLDPCAVDLQAMAHTLPLGIVGHDDAGGRIELTGRVAGTLSDGAVRVRWPRSDEQWQQRSQRLAQLVASSGSGGEILPNPISQLLPPELGALLGTPRGPALTVHPLGGCWIAKNAQCGVVDHLGRVFDPSAGSEAVHDGLLVLDGSIVPGSLGINPSLTIAALALRAVTLLRSQWMLDPAQRMARITGLLTRPIFCRPQPAGAPVSTKVAVLERLSGTVPLKLADGSVQQRVVQLTLRCQPIEVRALMSNLERRLEVQPGSQLRIFEPSTWQRLCNEDASEAQLDAAAESIAQLEGSMRLLHREASSPLQRRCRALLAWLRNRGLRDAWQTIAAQWSRRRQQDGTRTKRLPLQLGRRFLLAWHLASRAGEVRRFDYQLEVTGASTAPPAEDAGGKLQSRLRAGAVIRGHKRFTYSSLSNPWLQLQQMHLTQFPGLRAPRRQLPVLCLDARFLARMRVPLFQLVEQADAARALFELGSFLLYMLRVIITVHVWSFRKPEAPEDRPIQRLAGAIPGVPPPHIVHLRVEGLRDARRSAPAAYIQLTRYAHSESREPPVLLIHGYSANGNSFAHPAVKPNLAGYLWDAGRDVWVIDMRTSSGMLTAQEPWTFEDVAYTDIPAAIEHILQITAARKVDVVAHCMGSAMFSMALLGEVRLREPYAPIRSVLPQRVRSAVLLQVAPKIVFTPENVFRAYVMSYVRSALRLNTYQMRPPDTLQLADDILDRLLATVPYPLADRKIESPRNPFRSTAFAGTRHRMDALFGRVFNSQNIAPQVLRHIDDLFGPICLGTVFQTIHFANVDTVTTHDGRNEFATVERLRRRWGDLPTLSIHGADNGLASVATAHRTDALMQQSGMKHYRFWVLDDFGHQDVLIGKQATRVFAQIEAFLQQPLAYCPPPARDSQQSVAPAALPRAAYALLPKGALLRRSTARGDLDIAVAIDDAEPLPAYVVTLPVTRRDAVFEVPPSLQPEWLHLWSSAGSTADWSGCISVDVSSWPEAAVGMLVLLLQDLDDECLGNIRDPQIAARIHSAVQRVLQVTPGDLLERAFIARPAPAAQSLCFIVASCQYPSGPADRPLAQDSYARMAAWLEQASPDAAAQFLVLTGDQIYADATAGLFDPTHSQERYRARYQELFGMQPFQAVLRKLDTYMMLDDHEISDNWEPGAGRDRPGQQFFDAGVAAYIEYQRRLDPPLASRCNRGRPPLWHTQLLQGCPFFFCDTRTERSLRDVKNVGAATIMGELQFAELLRWLVQHDGVLRFVVSPSILLPRRLAGGRVYDAPEVMGEHLRSDAWDGFPDSFRRLLGRIARHRLENVVFLSGDEHLFCVARIELSQPGSSAPPVVTHSIHCSALYAPFVFANGGAARFAGTALVGEQDFASDTPLQTEDEFEFTDPDSHERFLCKVHTRYAPAGDGFAILRCRRQAAQEWLLEYEFSQRGERAYSGSVLLASTSADARQPVTAPVTG